jgi:hypothetical protein
MLSDSCQSLMTLKSRKTAIHLRIEPQNSLWNFDGAQKPKVFDKAESSGFS